MVQRVARAARQGPEVATAEIAAVSAEAWMAHPLVEEEGAIPVVTDGPQKSLVEDMATAFTKEYVDGEPDITL